MRKATPISPNPSERPLHVPTGGDSGTPSDRKEVTALADVWTPREDAGTLSDEIVGYAVQGTDGKIGSVDRVSFEGTCVFVSTGRLFGKKFAIPIGTVERVDDEGRTLFVDLSKDEVENSPQYDDQLGFDEACEERTGTYYRDLLASRSAVR